MGKLGKAFLFLMLVMLLLTGVSRAAAAFTVVQVQVERPKAGKIVHTVTGEGVVEQMSEQPVYAVESVLVSEILVQEGQTVKKGELLARLDMESIRGRMQELSDDMETLRLENEELILMQQKEQKEKSRAKTRASEDYDSTVEQGKLDREAARRAVEDAEQKVADALKEAEDALSKKEEELTALVDEAKRAYEEVCELAEGEILAAKRALEDAQKASGDDYSVKKLQLEISQTKSELWELYRRRREGEEGLDTQIRQLEDALETLQLALKEQESTDKRQEEERSRETARAQEDYENTVERCDRLVQIAFEALSDAEAALEDFRQSGAGEEDPAVRAARSALEEALRQEEELNQNQKRQELLAKRALEDASPEASADVTARNRIRMEEIRRQISALRKALGDNGEIRVRMDATVTQVAVSVGQRTADSAAFLVSDTSGGQLFTTTVTREDAEFVAVSDPVALVSGGKTYEELSVLSLSTREDDTVEVTVFVPEDTIAPGAYARMELVKQSPEYAVTVPLAAVHTENGKHFVYVMVPEESVLGGQFAAQRMDVTVAEKNGQYAAISNSSLTKESDVIVVSDGMISDGERVRLQEGAE